jgi:hypothetical protein
MTTTAIAIISAALVQAGAVVIALGRIQQGISDVRDDMRAIRQDIQSCLTTLLLVKQAGSPGEKPN